MKSVIEFAHYLLETSLTKNDTAIDFTAGNGNDTFFLAGIVNNVYAFDIQESAVERTKQKVKEYKNVQVILDTHQNFLNHVTVFKGAIFNLGYLPCGNKTITTKAESTLATIKQVIDSIEIGGICVIVIYPGHPEGNRESIAITEFAEMLNQKKYDVLRYEFINQRNSPPYLIAIRKKL